MPAAVGPSPGPHSRVDLAALAASVQGYFQRGLAPSTQKAYNAASKRFYDFCTRYQVETPFPLSEQLLCGFSAFLADQNLAPQTIKTYLSAVRNLQLSLGLPDPREQSSMPVLKRVQAGISRTRMLKGTSSRIRLPVTAQVLVRVHEFLAASSHPEKTVLWTIAVTAFFGFFRLGELLPDSPTAFNPATSLAWGDVAVDSSTNPQMVQVHLKRSKCDQYGAGADIVLGRTPLPLCPVTAILQYIEVRGAQIGPFFLITSKEPVTKSWFVDQFRWALTNTGLPQHLYSGHSFRIGAATSAALAGLEDSTIQSLGRWSSAAFLQYIRVPKESLAAISGALAQTALPPLVTT